MTRTRLEAKDFRRRAFRAMAGQAGLAAILPLALASVAAQQAQPDWKALDVGVRFAAEKIDVKIKGKHGERGKSKISVKVH